MKRIGLGLCLVLTALAPARAQVAVEITQEQDQYLPGEAIVVAVRITNRSGQTLRLGADNDWLTFSVESREHEIVRRTGEAPVAGEFELASSRVATKRVDVAPYFSASTPGGYSITATVRIKEWDREFTSQPKKFSIIEGAKLWDQDIGLPQVAGTASANPEVRRYTLQQAHYLRNQLRLYLRVTDATGGKVYRVVPVGPMVSFGRPEPQVDRLSNLHLLYQDKPHAYSYMVFNPDGEVVLRQTFDYIDSRPRLHPEGDGRITVVGGSRRVTTSDVPLPTPEELQEQRAIAPVPPAEIPQPKR